MQETFAAVAKALPTFDHQRPNATFRGWLWTITRNKIRDQARLDHANAVGGTEAQLRLDQVADADDGSTASENGLGSESEPPSQLESDRASIRRRTLEMLRDGFDPRTWRMFWETAIGERDPADVAEEMGVSRWAVYKARARVLHRLRQEMSGLE